MSAGLRPKQLPGNIDRKTRNRNATGRRRRSARSRRARGSSAVNGILFAFFTRAALFLYIPGRRARLSRAHMQQDRPFCGCDASPAFGMRPAVMRPCSCAALKTAPPEASSEPIPVGISFHTFELMLWAGCFVIVRIASHLIKRCGARRRASRDHPDIQIPAALGLQAGPPPACGSPQEARGAAPVASSPW
jgi:hypothetical protein